MTKPSCFLPSFDMDNLCKAYWGGGWNKTKNNRERYQMKIWVHSGVRFSHIIFLLNIHKYTTPDLLVEPCMTNALSFVRTVIHPTKVSKAEKLRAFRACLSAVH